jgi:hypothetical protein
VTLPALAEARDPHLLLRAVGEQWERFAVLNSWLHKLLIFVVRACVRACSGKNVHLSLCIQTN